MYAQCDNFIISTTHTCKFKPTCIKSNWCYCFLQTVQNMFINIYVYADIGYIYKNHNTAYIYIFSFYQNLFSNKCRVFTW